MEIARDGYFLHKLDCFQHLDHISTKAALVGKAVDFHDAVEQSSGSRVLKAEFSVEAGCGLRPVDIFHDRRDHAHTTDSLVPSTERTVQLETCGDPIVSAVLRRKKLDRETGIHDTVRLAVREQAIGIEATGIERIDES